MDIIDTNPFYNFTRVFELVPYTQTNGIGGQSIRNLFLIAFIQKIIGEVLSVIGIYSPDNELIKGLCILDTTNPNTYVLAVYNPEIKNSSAMFLLIDTIIRNEAGKEKVLDFEGSCIEGVARLYSGFGTKYHPYYILKKFRPSYLTGKLSI